jgi:hypothetical protein
MRKINIYVNGISTEMELPPELKDSKIIEENGKIYVEKGVLDYITDLQYRIDKAIEWGKYNLDRYSRLQLENILKGDSND